MSWGAQWQALAPSLHRALGGEAATLRRRYTLRDREAGRAVSDLRLDGAHSAGATTLALRSASAGKLQGELPTSLVLTLGGNDYTLSAEVDATGGASTLSATIAPALLTSESDGATVELADSVAYAFDADQGGAIVDDLAVDDVPENLVGKVSARIALARKSAPVTPRQGDLVAVGGRSHLVHAVERDWSGGWDLLAGRA